MEICAPCSGFTETRVPASAMTYSENLRVGLLEISVAGGTVGLSIVVQVCEKNDEGAVRSKLVFTLPDNTTKTTDEIKLTEQL